MAAVACARVFVRRPEMCIGSGQIHTSSRLGGDAADDLKRRSSRAATCRREGYNSRSCLRLAAGVPGAAIVSIAQAGLSRGSTVSLRQLPRSRHDSWLRPPAHQPKTRNDSRRGSKRSTFCRAAPSKLDSGVTNRLVRTPRKAGYADTAPRTHLRVPVIMSRSGLARLGERHSAFQRHRIGGLSGSCTSLDPQQSAASVIAIF